MAYRWLDVPQGHHHLSHHGKDPAKLEKIRRINRWHVEQLAGFLARMEATDDGGESLLTRSMIVFGSGLGDGNRHNHDDLPVLLAGRGNGTVESGRHLRFPKDTPMANLYQALLRRLRIRERRFADGTGALDLA